MPNGARQPKGAPQPNGARQPKRAPQPKGALQPHPPVMSFLLFLMSQDPSTLLSSKMVVLETERYHEARPWRKG